MRNFQESSFCWMTSTMIRLIIVIEVIVFKVLFYTTYINTCNKFKHGRNSQKPDLLPKSEDTMINNVECQTGLGLTDHV